MPGASPRPPASGGSVVVPYPYAPYGYYAPGYLYSPYCDPNTPYYDPQYC